MQKITCDKCGCSLPASHSNSGGSITVECGDGFAIFVSVFRPDYHTCHVCEACVLSTIMKWLTPPGTSNASEPAQERFAGGETKA